ncbi:T9SS type A sorting domain-containing protein [Prolixibacteraceae bacterium JC049]|nr:T9SS type A sorting domain-containing protein [Prolixibacteraceae bacterium JC049]
MKHVFTLMLVMLLAGAGFAQPVGYYNGTEGKKGDELKAALHQIIKGHTDFTYSFSKNIFRYVDEDVTTKDHVILLYTQRSDRWDNTGSGGDYINREHVWAKSHGGFSGIRPMDSDVHNLHPADASVNVRRSNKDFDNVTGGSTDSESGSKYDASRWEPTDAVKGAVARTILYMAVRYEGTDGEMNLEAVDAVDTSSAPEHGKLSTLLEWNRNFPPTALERRRNDRIQEVQGNRNPFVDNPEFADLIWGGKENSAMKVANVAFNKKAPMAGEAITLSFEATGMDATEVKVGSSFDEVNTDVSVSLSGDNATAQIATTSYAQGDTLYAKIQLTKGSDTFTRRVSYCFPNNITAADLTAIEDVQGDQDASPKVGEVVSVSGVVTANADEVSYLQSAGNEKVGLALLGFKKGQIGDSIVVTGKVAEYNGLTELVDISYIRSFGHARNVEPTEVAIDNISESYEGMLVKLNHVNIRTQGEFEGYSNYDVEDDRGNTIVLRVQKDSRLIGNNVPSDVVDIVGILSEYNGNYQIMPRTMADITLDTDTPDPVSNNKKLVMWPNPARDKVTISAKEGIVRVSFIDITGRVLKSIPCNGTNVDIPLNDFRSGVYMVRVEEGNGKNQVRRLIIK